jgi:hypothetical protein
MGGRLIGTAATRGGTASDVTIRRGPMIAGWPGKLGRDAPTARPGWAGVMTGTAVSGIVTGGATGAIGRSAGRVVGPVSGVAAGAWEEAAAAAGVRAAAAAGAVRIPEVGVIWIGATVGRATALVATGVGPASVGATGLEPSDVAGVANPMAAPVPAEVAVAGRAGGATVGGVATIR